MIELAATHFASRKPRSITVANRTLERGHQLADRFGAEAITLTELNERLPQFDVIVTCTASTLPIIGKGTLERVVRQRRHAPVLIVDLGVPRDVEPEAATLDDVFLYSVDDLSAIVKDNLQIRRERCRAGRADDRRPDGAFPALAATAAASCRRSPRCRRTTIRCAARSSSARNGCSRRARRRPTCSTRSRAD